jgi:hypothetical protein
MNPIAAPGGVAPPAIERGVGRGGAQRSGGHKETESWRQSAWDSSH